ncbi:synaptonemal complex protein 2-like [Ptychodera flava]|uniref:synaptonemal complex protein 2-like n=1 Tax=Ptychodera flava TaxID=63121 RepID=UPI00396A8D48
MKDPELRLQSLLLSSNKGCKYISELQDYINGESSVPQKCNIAVCDKMKSNIRQGLETGNIHQVCVMLDVISSFAKFDNSEGLLFLLEAGISKYLVRIFDKASHLLSKADEIHQKVTPEHFMERICDTITDIGENCLKGKAVMVSSFTELLMEFAIDTKNSFKTRIDVLKTLNPLLEGIENNAKEILQKTPDTFKLMTCLAKLLYTAGDFEMQVSIIETLFRTTVKKNRALFAKKWFHGSTETNEFAAIREKQFETDCRNFLNMLNSSMGDKQRVYSLPCISAILGNTQLQKPVDENLSEFWVDFNIESQSMTMFVSGNPDDPVESSDMWETIAIRKSDLVNFHINEIQDVNELVLTLSVPASELFEFVPNVHSTQVKITFADKFPLRHATVACFGIEKCQQSTEKSSMKASVPADSTLMRWKKDDAASVSSVVSNSPYQQSVDTSGSEFKSSDNHFTNGVGDSEVVYSLSSRKSSGLHKVSVPLEIIVTPRSQSAVKLKTPTTKPSSAVTTKSAKCYKICASDSEIASAKTPDRSKQRPSGRVKTPLQLVQATDSSDHSSDISSIAAKHVQHKPISKMQPATSPSETSISSTTEFTFKEPLPKQNSTNHVPECKVDMDNCEIVIPDSLPSPSKNSEEDFKTSNRHEEKRKADLPKHGRGTTSNIGISGSDSNSDISDQESVASSSRRQTVLKSPALSTVTEESLQTQSSQTSQGSDKRHNIKQMEIIEEEHSVSQSEIESTGNGESQCTVETSDNEHQNATSIQYTRNENSQVKDRKTESRRKYSLRNRTKEPTKVCTQQKETKTSAKRSKTSVLSTQQVDSQVSMFDFNDSPQADQSYERHSQKTREPARKKSKIRSPSPCDYDSLEASNVKQAEHQSLKIRKQQDAKSRKGEKQQKGVVKEVREETMKKTRKGTSKGIQVDTSEFDFKSGTTEESEPEQDSFQKVNTRGRQKLMRDCESEGMDSQELDSDGMQCKGGVTKGRGRRAKRQATREVYEESSQDEVMETQKAATKSKRNPRGNKKPATKGAARKTTRQQKEEVSSQDEFPDIEIAREAVRVQPSSILKKKKQDDDLSFQRKKLREKKPVNYAEADTSVESLDLSMTNHSTKKSAQYNKAKEKRSLFADNDGDDAKSVRSEVSNLSWLSEKKKPRYDKHHTYAKKTTKRNSIKMTNFSLDLPQLDDSCYEESIIDSIIKAPDTPKKKGSFSSYYAKSAEENNREVSNESKSHYFSSDNFYGQERTQKKKSEQQPRRRSTSSSRNDEEDKTPGRMQKQMPDVLSSTLATPRVDAIRDREKTLRQRNRRYSPLDVQVMKTPVTTPRVDDIEEQDSGTEDELPALQTDDIAEIVLTPITPADEENEDIRESEQEDEDDAEDDGISFETKSKSAKTYHSYDTSSNSVMSNSLRIKTPKVLRAKDTIEDTAVEYPSVQKRSNRSLLKSGPAPKQRPRRSVLKRKYKDIISKEDFDEIFKSGSDEDVEDDDDDDAEPVDEEDELQPLQPRKLFRPAEVKSSPSEHVEDGNILISADQPEEVLNESTSSIEEDASSSHGSFGVGRLMQELSAEIKTAMMKRKQLMQKSMNSVVHTTNKEMSVALKTDVESRQKLFHKFNDCILQEVVGFERRIDQLNEVQLDFTELFQKYQRKFSTLLMHSQSSLARIQDMYVNFKTEIAKQEESKQEHDMNIQHSMKKELRTMQKKILKDLQQQEIQKMKHALQVTLLSTSHSTC